jgi:uncharacterized damage-inducible protein DinB
MTLPEVWLRGPLPGIPAPLQPVAHALLQAREEVENIVKELSPDYLWTRPGGVASAGFHLQHLAGVLDRLFTYARGESLTEEQLKVLRLEGHAVDVPIPALVSAFHAQVERALNQLRQTDVATLSQPRLVGRNRLPSTVLGLLAHAAEHTQRHVGQLLVTVRVQR